MIQPISGLRAAVQSARQDLEPNEQGAIFAQSSIDSLFRSVQAIKRLLPEACIHKARYNCLQKDEADSSRAAKKPGAGVQSSLDTSNPETSAARRRELELLENSPQRQKAIEIINGMIKQLKEMQSYLETPTGTADKHPVLQDSAAWSMPD